MEIIKKLTYILTKKEKVYLLYILFLIILGSAFELLGVAIFNPYIDTITKAGTGSRMVVYLSLAIIVIYVFKNVFLSYEKNAVYKYSYDIQKRVSKKLLTAYMDMPYTFHLKTNPAELIRTIRMDADYFAKVVIHFIELIMELIVCGIIAIYLLIVSPIVTLIIVGLLAIVMLVYMKHTKHLLREMGREAQRFEGLVYQDINQALGGIKEIKVLERDDFFIDEFSKNLGNNLNILKTIRLMTILPKYFVEAVCIIGMMIAVIVLMVINQSGLTGFIPQIAVFATAAFRLMPSVGRINEHTTAIDGTMASVDLIYKDLKRIDGQEALSDTTEHGTHNNQEIWSELTDLEISNLEYKYPDSEKPVFTDVTFTIPKGQTVAFVGESGAGKTTLADCILGILKPDKGNIKIGDWDVYSNLPLWHKNIGYIPQFIYLSDDTIRNNIAFGINSDAIDEQKILEAAKKARLSDFVETLPEKYDTLVGERGARLSGGQRQRIGIARALYHDPEILVMDEATSALDNETENAVMESIDGLHGMKTIIIIAHRLSTIQNADLVLEVGNGGVTQKNKRDILG